MKVNMIRHIVESRPYLSLILTVGIGMLLGQRFPFPEDNAVLQLVATRSAGHFHRYQACLQDDAFHRLLDAISILYLFFVRPRVSVVLPPLPPYPMSMVDEGLGRK